jgi:hypothetical protein
MWVSQAPGGADSLGRLTLFGLDSVDTIKILPFICDLNHPPLKEDPERFYRSGEKSSIALKFEIRISKSETNKKPECSNVQNGENKSPKQDNEHRSQANW